MPKLVCLSGMNKGEEYELIQGENTIGRSEKNTICVFDRKTSRYHCKVHVDGDSLSLEDLNSTNGLRLNNNFMTGVQSLKMGDHIRLGNTVFLVSDRSVREEEDITSSAQFRKQQKYENLLQQTAFQVTKTTALRKLKTDKEGRQTGFLSFFQREDEEQK
ncbi:MAG: FHA domain-containing protein [Kiritimatiellaeota bacterium]|nr:FHA domain-containing protein [Kiritimatiellota bacterium]